MTDRAILAEMKDKEKAIHDSVRAAKKFADEHGLTFSTAIADGNLKAEYYGTGHEDRESYEDMEGWSSSFFNY